MVTAGSGSPFPRLAPWSALLCPWHSLSTVLFLLYVNTLASFVDGGGWDLDLRPHMLGKNSITQPHLGPFYLLIF